MSAVPLMRPPSAAASERSVTSSEASRRRPMSAWTREVTPPQKPNAASLDALFRSFSDRDRLQLSIDGIIGGAAMTGVQNYPYNPSQRLYHEDFSALVAGTITHPYLCTTKSSGSTPYDLMSGSSYDADRIRGWAAPKWRTEQETAYQPKNHIAAKEMLSSGIRGEQMRFMS